MERTTTPPTASPPPRQRRSRRILFWTAMIAGLLLAGILISAEFLLHHAGPMLKSRVVDSLSARFDSRVELRHFNVSVLKGLEVSGSGLQLYPRHLPMKQSFIQVDRFSFRLLDWKQLFATPMYIDTVQVRGLTIRLPPKGQRKALPSARRAGPRISILVGRIQVDRATLFIENGTPGKRPLQFIIHQLTLKSVGAGQPMQFHATLVNPKPVGNIDSSGNFGPFDARHPADTPVDGSYQFRNADLSTIKGIGGILSSHGTYSGHLNRIQVDGTTDTPDFHLDTADHPMPLKTKFHAIVDGTTGNTYLQPVDAWLMKTHIVAEGKVVRVEGVRGREIQLNVTVAPGRIQDLLRLAVKASPPLMNGQVRLHTTFDLPPGDGSVTDRLQLRGSFALVNTHFSNPRIQSKVDQLSLRGLGQPQQAKQESDAMNNGDVPSGTRANVASAMKGNFTFGLGRLTLSSLNYQVPGARAILSGVYSLDGQTLNFAGHAKLQAHVSQMVTGWKSWLLKPVDPFFAKHGAGTEIPIRITGTQSSPRFGLDF